jgi:hypothetical protein
MDVDCIILLLTFGLCSAVLREFARRRATTNRQFYITLAMWSILVYECVRYQFPELLTLPTPYRHYQHRLEMLLLAVYGWEALNYAYNQYMAAHHRACAPSTD